MNMIETAAVKLQSALPGGTTKRWFLKPVKWIFFECGIFFLSNVIIVYCSFFFTADTSVAMLGVLWVGIIAWHGGVYAGLLGCAIIYLSIVTGMNIPPHKDIPMVYYFDNRIPGAAIGFLQCLITALVVGYISTLFHKLREEVSLREKMQKALEQNIAQLDAFGHTVAHDLKNPLMVINMSIHSLMNDFESTADPKILKKLAFINGGTQNMMSIIESILLLAGIKKIDQNKITEISISECVDEALERMEYDIKAKGVQVRKPDIWPLAVGYAPWITEVWVNYINNAVKYGVHTEKQVKSTIELGYDTTCGNSAPSKGYIRFWVKDNGEGISKELTGTLFKEFTRLHVKEKKGYGLGLSIVKTIVDRLNGAVGVESDIGKGSLFYFTLPMKKAAVN
jgi:signal transduction histidine kinase